VLFHQALHQRGSVPLFEKDALGGVLGCGEVFVHDEVAVFDAAGCDGTVPGRGVVNISMVRGGEGTDHVYLQNAQKA